MDALLRQQNFLCSPGETITIGTKEAALLLPIFKKVDDRLIDATGDYDLCFNLEGTQVEFKNISSATNEFVFRFFGARIR
jgi:hypothetical protein